MGLIFGVGSRAVWIADFFSLVHSAFVLWTAHCELGANTIQFPFEYHTQLYRECIVMEKSRGAVVLFAAEDDNTC